MYSNTNYVKKQHVVKQDDGYAFYYDEKDLNLEEARNLINPLKLKARKPTGKDIHLLKEWASVRASVRDSVWAYIGSLFTGITNWKYVAKSEGYPYQSCVDLWKRGFIASFDGKYWRLHTGEDASIVFEIKKELLQEVK